MRRIQFACRYARKDSTFRWVWGNTDNSRARERAKVRQKPFFIPSQKVCFHFHLKVESFRAYLQANCMRLMSSFALAYDSCMG
ncbi:MAG: hypothetical protein AAFR87_35055, partial [Bacteroidota bacterium]